MQSTTKGNLWCITFITLVSLQSVYFGAMFQKLDSLLIGFIVFSMTTFISILFVVVYSRSEICIAMHNIKLLIGANLTSALAWLSYLFAVQLVEPAVAFTIFSGAIPLTTIVAAKFGVEGATYIRNRYEAFGNLIVLCSLIFLATITLTGDSGFVRGGILVAAAGITLSAVSGFIITWMLFFCVRLDRLGVGPLALFGLRFLLYVILAGIGTLLGLDHKEEVSSSELTLPILVGLVTMAFPIYATQRAITLVPSLNIGAIGALGPLLIFFFQLMEGRVQYSSVTFWGLVIYFIGAVLGAVGAALAGESPRPEMTEKSRIA